MCLCTLWRISCFLLERLCVFTVGQKELLCEGECACWEQLHQDGEFEPSLEQLYPLKFFLYSWLRFLWRLYPPLLLCNCEGEGRVASRWYLCMSSGLKEQFSEHLHLGDVPYLAAGECLGGVLWPGEVYCAQESMLVCIKRCLAVGVLALVLKCCSFLSLNRYSEIRLWSPADFNLYLVLLWDLEREQARLKVLGSGSRRTGSNIGLNHLGNLHAGCPVINQHKVQQVSW